MVMLLTGSEGPGYISDPRTAVVSFDSEDTLATESVFGFAAAILSLATNAWCTLLVGHKAWYVRSSS